MAVACQCSCDTAVGDGFVVRNFLCGSRSVISWSVAIFPVTISRCCALVFGWLKVRCSFLKQFCGPVALSTMFFLLLSPSRLFRSSFFAGPLIDLNSMLFYAATDSYLLGSPTRWLQIPLTPLTTVIDLDPLTSVITISVLRVIYVGGPCSVRCATNEVIYI
jgi:hypothetical protein